MLDKDPEPLFKPEASPAPINMCSTRWRFASSPDHKVRIRFAGFWPNDRKRVETRNSGAFDETVALDGHTATVKIQFGDDPCTVKVEFRSNKAIVEQGGSLMGCGFGFNVEPDGTYLKVSSKPPKMPAQ